MPSIINATTSTGLVQTADNSGSLQLQTNNGTTAVTIDTSQNVGIGTSSPTRKLSVNGDIRLGDGGGTGAIFTDATNGLRFMQPASGTSSTESMRITSSGNVLVGTSTNPSSANVRQVLATSGDTYIQFASGSTGGGLVGNTGATMLFYTYTGAVGSESYSERMRIDSSGNMLIGNTNATTRLSVKPASDTYQLYLMQGNQPNDGWKQWAEGNNGDLLFSRSVGGSDTERFRVSAGGNLMMNSGYGSVATAYGCRAWVNFNGTGTPAIRASGNVSSITDNGTGDYTVNFTNAMPDTNYCPTVGGDFSQGATRDNGIHIPSNFTFNTGSLRISTTNDTGAYTDIDTVLLAIFR